MNTKTISAKKYNGKRTNRIIESYQCKCGYGELLLMQEYMFKKYPKLAWKNKKCSNCGGQLKPVLIVKTNGKGKKEIIKKTVNLLQLIHDKDL